MDPVLNILISTPKKSNKPNAEGQFAQWLEIQGILIDSEGKQGVFTSAIFPKRGEPVPSLAPGQYTPVFAPHVSYDKRELTARIVGFTPIKTNPR